MDFRNKLTWMRDHHRGVIMGSVSAAAPYGTQTAGGSDNPIQPKNIAYHGSSVAPFGTDNNLNIENEIYIIQF
jgi:hypothetical protein